MKRIFSFFVAGLLIATTFSCTKEETTKIDDGGQKVAYLSFTGERPQISDETRTEWDGKTIVWSEGDKIRAGYTLNGEWMGAESAGEAKFYASKEVEISETNPSVGTFTVPEAFLIPEETGDFVFYAVYPNNVLTSTSVPDAPNATLTLKATQEPAEDSFDGTADLMVGKSATLDAFPSGDIQITWNRLVAHGYFTLKDFQDVAEGETITKVVFTAQDGANLAGEEVVSVVDGTVTATAKSTNVVTLSGANLAFVNETVDGVEMTNLKVWLSVLPVELTSLKVEVFTSKATYVREITGISKTLKKNARNRLAIKMDSADKTELQEEVWVKKDITKIKSTDVFVIVGNNGDDYALNFSNGTSAAPAATKVTVSDDKLTANPIDEIQWNLETTDDGYIFHPNGNSSTWLYCTSSNNGVRVGTNDAKVFKIDGGYLKHVGTSRYVGIYNSADWRCYTSNTGNSNIAGQTFAFYVKTTGDEPELKPVTITFDEPTTTVNVNETVTNVATVDPEGLTITYTSSNEAVATVTSEGVVTGVAAGVATIEAAFAGNDEYDEASAKYEITVVNPEGNDGTEEKPYTASEAAALASGGSTDTGVYVKGMISKITTAYNSQYGNVSFDISDDGTTSGSQFRIYRAVASSENDFKVGDVVTFVGDLTLYNTTPELAQGNVLVYHLHVPTLDPANGDATTVTITADEGATIRYTVDGTNPTAETGTVYSAPIAISAATTVKAIAIKGDDVTGVASGTYTVPVAGQYTLDGTITGGTNGYATESDIAQSGISWKVMGNTTISPWRLGGKNLDGADRTIYSTTPIDFNVASIEITHGTANDITVNSMTVIVASDADFTNVVSTFDVDFMAEGTVTIGRGSGLDWTGCYYKIVYNVTVSGDANKFIQFTKAVFSN